MRGDTVDEGRRQGAHAAREARGGRRRLRRRHGDARARGRARSSPTRSRSCSTACGAKRGQLAAVVTTVQRAELIDRIWERDATVWTGADEAKWLGWLDEPSRMRERVPELLAFADDVADDDFDAIVLLGMGGSSLAPEVLRRTFGSEAFHVLDTTHPDAIRSARGDDRPRAHALHLRVEVGLDARDALAHRLLLGALRQARRVLRRHHRSGLRARADGGGARLPPRVLAASRRSAAATPRSRRSAWCPRR